MEKIDNLLKTQFVYINYILINIEYILKHNEQQYLNPSILQNKKYLHVIARLCSEDTILNLYKLFMHSQHYSFNKLIASVNRFLSPNRHNFMTEYKESFYNNFLLNYKEGLKVYNNMNIKDIRNKYVGHLDSDRVAIEFDLEEIKKIKNILESIEQNLSNAFYNGHTESKLDLIELLDDNVLLKKYQE